MEQNGQAIIFGATSFVGRYLIYRLAELGFSGFALTTRKISAKNELPSNFSWYSLRNEEKYKATTHSTIFSLVPITALPSLIAHLGNANKLIALSTSSTVYKICSPDAFERKSAEGVVDAEKTIQQFCKHNKIDLTILRPTLIYDSGMDQNISSIAFFIKKFKFFPIVWPGDGKRQPIHADDVAQAMVAAFNVPFKKEEFFYLPGSEIVSYKNMVIKIFEALGMRPLILYLPPKLARILYFVWQKISGGSYSFASLDRMNQDLTFDGSPVKEVLGINCRPFSLKFGQQND